MDIIKIISSADQPSMSSHPMDAVLRPLFVALPLQSGLSVDSLLAGYRIALADEDIDATKSVITKLVKGTWYDPIIFCPRPPELANMVRREAKAMADKGQTRADYIRDAIKQNNSW